VWLERYIASVGTNKLIDHREKGGGVFTGVGGVGIVSLLLGLTIASLLPILLNVRELELTAAILLAPGGLLTSLVAPTELGTPPLFLIAANAVFYGICCFLLGVLLRRRFHSAIPLRFGARSLAILGIVLFALACVPQFDPLWPHGMAQLATREAALTELLRPDMTIDQVRAALQRESITVREEIENSTREVLRNRQTTILGAAGDRMLSSRFRMDATQFPCGYDLQIVVLFGPDGKIKTRYVAPLPVCP